jgi:hypothetical protein
MLGMGVDRGTADEPLQDPRVESGGARFLQAKAAPSLLAHGPQHFLLRSCVILRADIRIADADQSLPAVTGEDVGNAPNGKAHHQEADQDQTKRLCRALAQCIECHASSTFRIINCQIRAGVRW